MTPDGKSRIACQTITWGDHQSQKFPEVFQASAEAGYSGLEIGFRHIQAIPPQQLNEMLAAHGLRLVASHVGGNLEDTDQADGERQMLDTVLDYLNAIDTRLLMYSGLKFEDAAQFERDLAQLRKAAIECRERNVQLLYHNHDWEFAEGGRVINALIDSIGPELGFCPDIGWIAKGGADITEVLDRMGERVGAVHLKDFASLTPGVDSVLLGEGVVPLEAAVAWTAAHRPDVWLIAEQDDADIPAAQAIRNNAHFIQQLLEDTERAR